MKDGVLMNKTCNNVFFTEMKQYAESNLELSTHTYCIAYPRYEKAQLRQTNEFVAFKFQIISVQST